MSSITDDLYQKLVNEEDARVCRDISDDACRETPGNFLRLIGAYFLTKLGDAVASPKTVLAWVTNAVGAPAWVLGFLVPIRESGSLIPQLLIAGFIRRLEVRKWVWVVGSILQAGAIVGLGWVAVTLEGDAAGWAILGLITLFSLARGFCSVASKDVLGKTVPKTRRGQLTGWSASLAGLVTVGVGVSLTLPGVQSEGTQAFGWLLAGAGCLWVLAAALYGTVKEYPGETEGGGNAITEALRRADILRTDRAFRHFVIARALLMCSALSAPFYVALGQQQPGTGAALLGLFVIADGLASLLSAPIWGRFADRSSRWVMVAAAVLTSGTGLAVFAIATWFGGMLEFIWFMPVAYFVLSVAHWGVRVGRKTYVVDLASGNRRTDYVAVSNTVIGFLLLAAGTIGALASVISTAGVIAVLSLMGLAGAWMSASLPDVT
ncbi:MAG: MFS transporter [Gammaproteobacteria bacterium]